MSGHRNWNDVKEDLRASGFLTPEREAKIAESTEHLLAEVRACQLADVRRQHQLTQVQVAEAMGVSQSRVSELEHGAVASTEVSTLRRYIEAIGGRLRVVVEFDDAEPVALA